MAGCKYSYNKREYYRYPKLEYDNAIKLLKCMISTIISTISLKAIVVSRSKQKIRLVI